MTHAQLARIDKLPEECRVIGMEKLGNPVIAHPNGDWQVVDHTGRLRAASYRVRLELAERQIEVSAWSGSRSFVLDPVA